MSLPRFPRSHVKVAKWFQTVKAIEGASCPLECYLLAQGADIARVGHSTWTVMSEDGHFKGGALPKWAKEFVKTVDLSYRVRSRGREWSITGHQAYLEALDAAKQATQ